MTDRYEKPDHYSGIPWVYVPPDEARAHPQGQLTVFLWIIAIYLIGAGVAKAVTLQTTGVPLGWALVISAFPILCGIGLILRMPWAIILATISAGLTVFQLVGGLGRLGEMGGNAVTIGLVDIRLALLFHLLVSVGIVFYLMDGDRPNFIYRHRYRKYSVLKKGDE